MRHIGRQLRAQWAGYLSIFLFLSVGTAYALPGSNTVFSDDIVDGQVHTADVADDSLTGRDIRILGNRDIANDALGTGQVGESSLGTVPVAGQAGSGRVGTGSCGESPSYIDCGSLPIDLAKPGRLLIIASVVIGTELFVRYVLGPCRLEVNGAPIDASETLFQFDDEGGQTPSTGFPPEGAGGQATLTAVSHVYPTGRQIVGVECSLYAPGEGLDGTGGEADAYVDISAVALSDG
ncbi:hypothetical protein D0Z08_25975 [Nocardioides immobilis]|uniref:Uncharacterized protein n=1 Tax=Nocardioides immobilis TaxID=2049295 RepID=A0A417XV61_9ACTN|nr:hypothetical protein D0Z08_25975 [Nocardioides immobilis]